ncbi:unnamed protein product [Porites evermanni]|uniref:TIR domain-containing protein n=1 Tax=Porites evermanni TaxID=104178 RepID=A0ABN8T1H4_9CNID|nr:unnamed protein product [Porites evermanni]
MGAGASRNHHSKGIPSPPRESLSPVKDTVQPKIPVQDQHFSHEAQNKDIKQQVDVARTSHTNTDKKASPNDTLETYIVKHPDQAEDLETMLERLQALKNFVAKNLNDPEDYATLGKQTIEGLFETSVHTFESAGTQEEKEFITLIEFTIDVGGAEQLKLFVQHCFKKFSYLINEESDDEEETDDYTCYDCLSNTLAAIQNFSDFHQGFCSACAGAGIISMCFEIVKQIDAENSNWEEEDEDSELVTIIDNSIGILHNISRRLRDRELFANREQTLLYFAKKKVPAIAAESLLTLAYLVDENTNHLILADENLLSFIITLLDEAWQSEDRHSNGYSAKELAEGLGHLAINDANKNILGQNGVIPVLISVIKTSNEDEEKASATRALWMLAFDDNNKEKVRQEEGAIDILHQLQQSKNSEVQKAAAGALWELEGKTARQSSEKIESTGNHVMISYQWDSQEVLVEVKNRLQASGYRVWMDLEQMGGSTLEAMAKAVENSSVVLICVSERYKESPNCRSEAEYAYQLRKDIIPLMMQRKYRGDGWLGMLVGTKLWFDFQSKHVLEQGVTKLIRELGGRGKELDVTDGPSEPAVQVVQADVLVAPSSPGVSTWTNKDVKQWFKEIGLEKVCEKDISEMNGQTLIDLQELRGECPDYFYKCIERTLKLTDMFDLLKFRKELSKLA